MAPGIDVTELQQIQALNHMSVSDNPFLANLARATLAMVEARRDAQVRAEIAEAHLEETNLTLGAIRELLAKLPAEPPPAAFAECLRQIAVLVMR